MLVTVYQSADGAHDAPKLQVIRLSDQPAPPEAEAPAPIEEPSPVQPVTSQPIEVAAHIYGRGDVGGRLGEWMGEPGSKRWIEGFGLAPSSGVGAADIEYQAVLGRGWLSPWAEGGQFCGSRGMSLPILGLRVRLRGEAASAYAAVVSASFVDGTRVGPVSDGSAVEAPSLSPLEAFQVTLKRSGRRPGRPARAGREARPQAGPCRRRAAGARSGRSRCEAAPDQSRRRTPTYAGKAVPPEGRACRRTGAARCAAAGKIRFQDPGQAEAGHHPAALTPRRGAPCGSCSSTRTFPASSCT